MWSTIILIMSILDIVKGMNTGFYHKGELVDDKLKIRHHYKNDRLPYDIISSLSVLINRAYFPGLNYVAAYVINILVFTKGLIDLAGILKNKKKLKK